MTKILFAFLLLSFAPVAAYAQDGPEAEAETPVSKERLALAEKMHEIWPIRVRMERALDGVAENFPEERRTEIRATMRRSIQWSVLEDESIKAMADIFTEEELQAMIDFYGSETGRSISAKTGDYEMALRPVLTKMIDKAMLDMRLGAPQ